MMKAEGHSSHLMSPDDELKPDRTSFNGQVAELSVEVANGPEGKKKDWRFWVLILSIMASSYLVALDLVGIGTALPIIIKDLGGTQFEWVGSAYALSATAFLPLSGGLAQVFGRKIILYGQLFLFAAGSAICGAAPNMGVLIAGRAIEGIGAGGIASLAQIIISDLVPLHERGAYNALVSVAYFIASATGPVISGSLAQDGQWRWFFYLNLPVCGVVAILLLFSTRLQVPHRSFREKVTSVDWTGNFIVVGSTTAVVIALTWGGITFPWKSARVLVPLILGSVGLVFFIIYEGIFPKNPLVPPQLLYSRTAISGYLQSSLLMFFMMNIMYYLPIYYEACKAASPLGAAVDVFVATFLAFPVGIVAAIIVTKTGRYRPQLWFSWIILIVGFSLYSTLTVDTSRSASIAKQVPHALGYGVIMTIAFFPVLAPISVDLQANAMAFLMFLRFFSQVWGVTVGGTILQNQLKKELPAELLNQFPQGTAVAYSIIPLIRTMEEPLKRNVQEAFAHGLRVIWLVLVGIAVFAFLASLLMEGLPLHTSTDKNYGIEEAKPKENPASETDSNIASGTSV